MDHATKSSSDQQREGPASQRPAAPSAAATLADNRPAAVAQRAPDGISDSPRVLAQQASLRVALSPRVIEQGKRLEGMFGRALQRRSDPAHVSYRPEGNSHLERTRPIQRQTALAGPKQRAASGVVQRITREEIEEKLPEKYKKIFVEWVRARTLPTAERPEKYKDPTKALTHFLDQIPSIGVLQQTLDAYEANKKADAERNDEALRELPRFAVQTISSYKLLKESGASINEDDLAKAIRILDDDAFFKAHLTISVQKLAHRDPYEIKVLVGARLNEDTKAFAEKGMAYFKTNVEYSTVIHETLHVLCRTPVKNLLGHLLNEGITELLTEWTCADEGAKYVADYEEEKKLTKAAFLVVGKLQKSFLARTYFSDPKEMATLLGAKLGREKFEQFKSMSDADAALKLLSG